MPRISSSAIVEKTAELADDVQVGAFAYVGAEVRVGPGCVIENSATVMGKTVLGARTHVFPLAVVGADPEPDGGSGECVIGEANAIREHVTICAGRETPTRIGQDNLIMIASQVGAEATVGSHVIMANSTHVGVGAVVEDYVRTSGFTVISPGATVGAYTFTAGYSEVVHDVPPYAMIQGSPIRVRGVNTTNLRRCGFGEEDIRDLKDAFRDLFNGSSDSVSEQALQRLLAEAPASVHVRGLAEALRKGLARRQQDD